MSISSASSSSPGERKTRAELDQFFAAHPEREVEFFAYVESHTLAQAQEFLATDGRFKLALSTQTISVWAAKKRAEAAELKFQNWLGDLAANSRKARRVIDSAIDIDSEVVTETPTGAPGKSVDHFAAANDAVLNASLLKALQTGATADIKLFAKLTAQVGETRAKQRAATAALLSAETASKRFYFDAAKAALEHAAELQAINESAGSKRNKIERAVVRLFGTKPSGVFGTDELLATASSSTASEVAGPR